MDFASRLYLALLLFLLLATTFIISLFFVIQRKPWQRIAACIFGGGLYIAGLIGLCNNLHNNSQNDLFNDSIKTAAFFWIVVVMIIPRKNQAGESSVAVQHKIRSATLIFSVQLLLGLIGYAEIAYDLYLHDWPQDYFNVIFFRLLVLLAGVILFYLGHSVGWLLLSIYFMFQALCLIIYIVWLLYAQYSQTIYHLLLSGSTIIYLVYYTGCLYFFAKKETRLFFNISAAHIYFAGALSLLLAVTVSWTRFIH